MKAMDKGIRKVRARIKQRKRKQTKINPTPNALPHHNKDIPLLFSDEEKHGFQLPMYDRTDNLSMQMEKKPRKRNNSFRQAFYSFVLFISCVILFKTSIIPFSNVNEVVHDALTEEFPFAKVHHWYVETLGVPLAFTPKMPAKETTITTANTSPIHGEVMETFATNGTGIMISPNEESEVRAWKQGMVVFSGKDKTTDQTVTIQHPDGSKTTYGLLSSIDVHIYKFVEENEVIGSFTPTKADDVAYFSIEKDKQFIDPTQVIRVDDLR